MPTPPYCRPTLSKVDDYFLRFARLSGWDVLAFATAHREEIIATLNLLPQAGTARHALLPLIHHNIWKMGLFAQLSMETQTFLKDHTRRRVAGEMVNHQWLQSHLRRFVENDIPVILLKAAAFSGSLYPESAPRLGVDLDLLVRRRDFDTACALIEREMDPVILSAARLATHDSLFERMFVQRNRPGPTVEIHRALTNPFLFAIDEDQLWSASQEHPTYRSAGVRRLSPEDTLLHLAVHAFRDLDFCTHNLLDAHEVFCQWQPDPGVLLACASQWGAKKVLFYLLENLRVAMETPIAPWLLKELAPSKASNGINQKILRSGLLADSSDKPFQYRLLQLISQITFPDNPLNGIRFQIDYARTRLADRVASR